jgi:type 1 fimbria pilin
VKRKILVAMLLAVVAAASCSAAAFADVPYRSYNYDYWGNIVPSPVSYEPVKTVSGSTVGLDHFNLPGDMSLAPNGDLYLADTGNNRIVVLDPGFALKKVIDRFDNKGKKDTFSSPGGITVGSDGKVHIADTQNHRIVTLNPDGTLVRAFGVGKNTLTGDSFIFQPSKIGVDSANRYYVVAKNVFEGMMSFDANGSLLGYFGTIKVQSSLADKFWKTIATKEQRSKMQLFIPTEFTSLDIDSEGFVYATDLDDGQTIRRINPSGKDVLVNYNTNKPVCGDLKYRSSGAYSGPTVFTDIKARGKGIYSALDSTRGRVYTYDSEGNLLYVFGGMGTELGTFKTPVAIECRGDSIYVLDQAKGQIVVFQPTKYGQLITKAVGLRYDGDESQAVEYWQQVLKLDSHYELAYSGIGKSLLAVNKNKEAMEYLKKGMNKRYYSVAFRRYRTEFLKAHSTETILIILAIVAFAVGRNIYKRTKGRKKGQ